MTIWNGLTSDGAVVPVQVDDQGRVIAVGSGPDSPLVVDGNYLRPRDATKGLGTANINLDATGGGTFASDLKAGTDNFFEWRKTNGVCQLFTTSKTATQALLYGQSNFGGSTFDAFTFKCDGSSRLMGQLQISIASVGGITEKVLLHENGWIRVYNPTADASANMYLAYSDVNGAGTVGFYVTANGVISARSRDINQIGSERRLKNTIEPLDPVTSWETIRELPYYSYKLNGNDESTYYGPIVDECPEEMIIPGATNDERGNIRTFDNGLLQGRLFVALQTALKRIEDLEAVVGSTMPSPEPPGTETR
jgi:hypothetical protein